METAATQLSSSTEDWGVRVKSAHDRAAAARERVERGRERRARGMREGRPDRQGRSVRRRLDQRTQTTDSRSAVCSSVNAGVSDQWCSKNCNAPLPNCPDGVCSCEAKEQQQQQQQAQVLGDCSDDDIESFERQLQLGGASSRPVHRRLPLKPDIRWALIRMCDSMTSIAPHSHRPPPDRCAGRVCPAH